MRNWLVQQDLLIEIMVLGPQSSTSSPFEFGHADRALVVTPRICVYSLSMWLMPSLGKSLGHCDTTHDDFDVHARSKDGITCRSKLK